MNNFFKYFLVALVGVSAILGGCTLTRKISAAEILSKTKLEFESVSLDSVAINPNLFPDADVGNSLLPNPQVVAMVQEIAQGILEKEIGRANISMVVRAENGSQDTLWLKNLKAVLHLDSIISLSVDLLDSMKIAPGVNSLTVMTQMPIDKRILQLMKVDTLRFVGQLDVALESDGPVVPLEFDMKKYVTQEEKVALSDKARNYIINTIVEKWVGALFRF